MKKIMMITAGLFLATGLFAQTHPPVEKKAEPAKTAPAAHKEKNAGAKYCCMDCDFSAEKAGMCPNHKTELVKEGMYYCAHDHMTSDKAGKCPKCGMGMAMMKKKAPKMEMKKEAPKSEMKKEEKTAPATPAK